MGIQNDSTEWQKCKITIQNDNAEWQDYKMTVQNDSSNSSNWILMSCQPHSTTSGQQNDKITKWQYRITIQTVGKTVYSTSCYCVTYKSVMLCKRENSEDAQAHALTQVYFAHFQLGYLSLCCSLYSFTFILST